MRKKDFETLSDFRYQLRRFLRFSEEVARSHGVTHLQYQLLLHVRGLPGREWATVSELAERLQSHHHGTVSLISRCVKLGLVLGHSPRRMMSVSESKKRLEQRARNEVNESKETVETLTEQIAQVKAEAEAEFAALAEKWQAAAQDVQPLRLTPKRADILLEVFGLGWRPMWKLTVDGQPLELPAYL